VTLEPTAAPQPESAMTALGMMKKTMLPILRLIAL
jgi:hypothetical protein